MKTKFSNSLIFLVFFSFSNLFSQEIGIQLYSLRNQFNDNIENTIKKISDWGINIVEGGDSYGISDESFIKLLDKYNIKTVAIGASYDNLRDNIDDIISDHKNIGYLFSNAGIHLSGNIENTSINDIDNIININLKGTLYTLKYIIKHMKENKFGRIVLNSSDQAFIGKPSSTVYGSTKAAISQIAKSISIDYSNFNIHANAICPGTIETPLYHKAIRRYHEKSQIPLDHIHKEEENLQLINRIGKPEEVANLVEFLLSDKADFITGANIPIDGGYTAR